MSQSDLNATKHTSPNAGEMSSESTNPIANPIANPILQAPIDPLRAGVEAILLVVDTPVAEDALARALDVSEKDIREVLTEIEREFTTRRSGIELRETQEGWRFYTAPAHASAVERFLLDGSQTKLSRAAMETLAVIAYRQPATRAQVSAVRGVNVDGVMRTLQARGLIAEAGTEETSGAHLYVTTSLFLEQLGIDSLDALPDLAPLLPDVELIDEPLA